MDVALLNGKPVSADGAGHGYYRCPACRGEVAHRVTARARPHFYHLTGPTDCPERHHGGGSWGGAARDSAVEVPVPREWTADLGECVLVAAVSGLEFAVRPHRTADHLARGQSPGIASHRRSLDNLRGVRRVPDWSFSALGKLAAFRPDRDRWTFVSIPGPLARTETVRVAVRDETREDGLAIIGVARDRHRVWQILEGRLGDASSDLRSRVLAAGYLITIPVTSVLSTDRTWGWRRNHAASQVGSAHELTAPDLSHIRRPHLVAAHPPLRVLRDRLAAMQSDQGVQ